MQEIVREIQTVRLRSRVILLIQRISSVLAGFVALFLALSLIDFTFRLPGPARLLIDLAALAGLGWAGYRFLWPSLRFRPSLTDIALRIERNLPDLAGHLATGVDFELSGAGRTSTLAEHVVNEAERRAQRHNLIRAVITRKRAYEGSSALIGLLVLAAVITIITPESAAIAAMRWINPLGHTQWYKRTGVESAMTFTVYPKGRALPLRAQITRGFNPDMRVMAHYRLESGSEGQQSGHGWEKVILTYQNASTFERLIEAGADKISVWFETDDDRTPVQVIDLVPVPTVEQATLHVEPPAYARGIVEPRDIDLGNGADERAVVAPPVLKCSTVTMRVTFNKPIPSSGTMTAAAPASPEAVDSGALKALSAFWADQMGLTFSPEVQTGAAYPAKKNASIAAGAEATDPSASHPSVGNDKSVLPVVSLKGIVSRGSGERQLATGIELQWVERSTVRFHPMLKDEYDLIGPDDLFFRIDMQDDAPPSVTLMAPDADHSYLPSAYVPLEAEGRDDVSVGQVSIESRSAGAGDEDAGKVVAVTPPLEQTAEGSHPPVQSPGASTESVGETAITTMRHLSSTLDLMPMNLKAGDTIELVAKATDTYEFEGSTHSPAVSTPRLVRIISTSEFVEQIHQNLSAVRDSAIRIAQDQDELRQRLSAQSASADDQRNQAGISRQVNRQADVVRELAQRLEDNRLDQPEIRDVLDEAKLLLNDAGKASGDATESIARTARNQAQTDDEARKLREQTAVSQKEVSDQLATLIGMLDQGRDSWVMRRQVGQLLEDQKKLADQSRQATDAARGRTPEQLTAQQNQQLEDLAQQQGKLAKRSSDLMNELDKRAEQLKKDDPALADAMRQAAGQARQNQLEQTMQQAARQIQQNQGERAGEQQNQAMNTLQSMMQQLENSDKAQAQELVRHLEDLKSSIEALIKVQQEQLNRLVAAQSARQPATDLDAPMIHLSTNTYAVRDQAAKLGRQLDEVAKLLDGAGRDQEAAVGALRQNPPDAPGAQSRETQSLASLRQAHDLASKLLDTKKQQEAMQKKAELIKAYRDLHEREAALRGSTQPLVAAAKQQNGQLDRRQLVAARQLGSQQIQIRNDANDLLNKTREIADAIVFHATHEQIASLAQSVGEDLRAGRADQIVLMREDDTARLLMALAQALEDSQNQDEFAQKSGNSNGGGGGGGGGGGPQPLVPPVAQIKLLRAMQQSVYQSTRSLDEAGAAMDPSMHQERLQEIGQSQEAVADMAAKLIQELQQSPQQGPQSPQQPKPTEPPGSGTGGDSSP